MPRRKGQTPDHVRREREVNWKNFKRRQRMETALPSLPQDDAALIARAVAEGRVTKCPDGYAVGALRWTTGGSRTSGDPE